MNPISTDQLVSTLNWRYATKKFDPNRKIPEETWAALEESLILTPSSYGLQPWKFIIITDQAVKESLVGASYGQTQVADCSHLVVMAAKKKMTVDDVDRFIDSVVEKQGKDKEKLQGYRNMMIGDIVEGPRSQDSTGWAKLQCYIALGQFMTSTALLGIDACPMEGFSPPKYDEALGLEAKGLTTAVLCPVGYRNPEDNYGDLPKVRFGADSMVERIG